VRGDGVDLDDAAVDVVGEVGAGCLEIGGEDLDAGRAVDGAGGKVQLEAPVREGVA
jgi:hypothetical protein